MENNENVESIDNQPTSDGNSQPAAASTPPPAAPAAPAQPITGATTQQPIPKGVLGMVFGIISVVFYFLGPIGIIFGLLGVLWYSKGKKLYNSNPEGYTKGSKIMGMIGAIAGWVGMPLGLLATFMYVMLIIEAA